MQSKGLSRVFSSFTVQKHETMGGQELAHGVTGHKVGRFFTPLGLMSSQESDASPTFHDKGLPIE